MDLIKKILFASLILFNFYETKTDTTLNVFNAFPEGYKKIESFNSYSKDNRYNQPFLKKYNPINSKLSFAYFHLVDKHNMKFGDSAIIVLGKEQKLYLITKDKNPKNLEESLFIYDDVKIICEYPISTGRGGFGNILKKAKTPTGSFKIIEKLGGDLDIGTVIGRPEGIDSILTNYSDTSKNSPGLLVSRLIRLGGLDEDNKKRFNQIGIHGTNQEQKIGGWASGGCIRLKNNDVIDFYKIVRLGIFGEVTDY